MSDKKYTEEILDNNLEKLLQQTSETPKISAEARGRIKQNLLQKQKELVMPKQDTNVVPITAKKPTSKRGLFAGVGALLAAGLATLLLLSPTQKTSEETNKSYQNDSQKAMQFALPDGSKLLLQQNSSAQTTGDRALTLSKGGALLDVVPGKEPFVVTTPQGKIQVLGTRFIVESRENETEAAVIRGVVKLMGDNPIELHAGEFGAVSTKTPPARRPAEKISYTTRWAKALLSPEEEKAPARSGLLLARNPQWQKNEWPLPLRKLDVDVYVEDQVARVALDQTFFNFTSFQLEGVYSFPLPPDAALSRLAMYIDGKKMEAGIAERNAARDVYESIVYQRRDPALLEWVQGNQLQLKIFPLPSRQEKRILLSYTQSLSALYGSYRIEVPLPELEQSVNEVNYKVKIVNARGQIITSPSHEITIEMQGDDAIITAKEENVKLGNDLILDVTKAPETPKVEVTRLESKDGKYLMASLTPDLPGESKYEPRRWVFLYDTSASRRSLLTAQLFAAKRLLQELDEDDEIMILAFDSNTRAYSQKLSKVKELNLAEVEAFFKREQSQGIGETSLTGALKAAMEKLSDHGDKAPYVLYLGDGLDTKDATVSSLSAVLDGKATFVGVALGDTLDASLLRGLAEKTGGLFAALNPGDDVAWRCFDLIAALNTTRLTGVEASLLDASGQPIQTTAYPSARQVGAGEQLMIVSKLTDVEPSSIVLKGFVHNQPWSATLALPKGKTGAKYLPRLWAQERIEELSQDKEKNQEEITKLGLENFLLTPFTSLLVLETDEMYAQFKVNRGSEDDWARYAAPDKIKVVTEPTGVSFVVEIPSGAKLYRTPVSPFGVPQYNSPVTGSSAFTVMLDRTNRERDDSGALAGGLRSTGTGGGGEGTNGLGTESTIGAGGGGGNGRGIAEDLPRGEAAKASASDSMTYAVGGKTGKMGIKAPDEARKDEKKNIYQGIYKKQQVMSRSTRRTAGYDYYYGYQNITLIPQAFSYAYDTRLDDLTEFVPGLFGDPLDLELESLWVGAASQPGSISPEAKALLEKARAAQHAARFQTKDNDLVEVAADGSFLWKRTLETSLKEEVVYDQKTLQHRYPELMLATERDAKYNEALLFARWAPFLTARPEVVSALYQVTAKGNTVIFTPLQKEATTIEITFSSDAKPTSIKIGEEVTTLTYNNGSIEITSGSDTLTLTEVTGATSSLTSTSEGFAVVKMPLVEPSALTASAPEGSPEWRELQWQKLASFAALSRLPERAEILRALAKTGTLSRGELTLASGAIQQIGDKKELAKILALLPKEDAVAQYANAIWRISYGSKGGALAVLAEKNKGSLIGMLELYRSLLAGTQNYYYGRAIASQPIEKFMNEYKYASFSYILVYYYSSYNYWSNPKSTIALWEKLADSSEEFHYLALYEAARYMYNYGTDREKAAEMFETIFNEELAKGNEPAIDYTFYYALAYTSEGQTRWQRFANEWRARVLKSGSVDAISNWLYALSFSGRGEAEINRIIPALRELKLKSAEEAMPLIDAFSSFGRYDIAQDLLAPWLTQKDTPGELYDLASQLAESNGDNAKAAEYLNRSLDMDADKPMPLGIVREKYQKLFTLYSREAQSINPDKDAARKALVVANEWRKFDPDYADRELLCASLLNGLQQTDESWRYLSTIIELHPGDGATFETIATYLEGESQWEEAASYWDRAIKKEPTNPTWLYRRALTALTLGDKAKAKEMLTQVKEGKWQDRFSWTNYQAEALLKRLNKK